MFKRLFWLGVGAAGGVASTRWVKKVVKRRVTRYVPDKVVTGMSHVTKMLGDDLKAAIREGRLAKREYRRTHQNHL